MLADDSADPDHVASDLVSQAEHDPLAAALLVTDSPGLADAVEAALVTRVAATKHTERVSTALAGTQSAIVLVDDVDAGLDLVNAYAAEHLEVQTRDAAAVAARVRNAGAVFVGPFSPVSPRRLLRRVQPRAAHGRVRVPLGGLSVQSFLRGIHVVTYTEEALREVGGHVVTLARAEDLPGARRGGACAAPRPRHPGLTRLDPRTTVEAMLRPICGAAPPTAPRSSTWPSR